MALDIEDFIPDSELTEDGVWVPLDDETKVLATFMSPDFMRNEMMRRQRQGNIRNPHLLDRPEYLRNIEDEGIRKHIKGWEGMKKGGEAWPFLPENLEFIIKRVPDFRASFLTIIQNSSHFVKRQMEDDQKNSQPSSNGSWSSNIVGEGVGERS